MILPEDAPLPEFVFAAADVGGEYRYTLLPMRR